VRDSIDFYGPAEVMIFMRTARFIAARELVCLGERFRHGAVRKRLDANN
jgi:hypothetical protein